MVPKAVFFDLDDTILNDSLNIEDCWELACARCQDNCEGLDAARLVATITRVRDWYWSDLDRHQVGRLDLRAARREIVRLALVDLDVDDVPLAHEIGDAYTDEREARMEPLPGAIDTVRWLRQAGRRLALLTNGSGPTQRRKLTRFALTDLFHLVLIEGELGFGKPDPRVFARALDELAVDPSDAWMVGDNLEWDVRQAQRMGLFAVWVDGRGRGVPEDSDVRPDRIVRSVAELRDELERSHWR